MATVRNGSVPCRKLDIKVDVVAREVKNGRTCENICLKITRGAMTIGPDPKGEVGMVRCLNASFNGIV
ncbi:MAG TPA: hypothetical protein DIV46_05485 [Verrucomicrobiales bacterium]|nr:hypothetical protein [Verrucomicrobiales bacterium]